MARPRIGSWLIGAKGGVAATAITGLVALRKGLIGPIGLVSELAQFQCLDLADWNDFVVGGHDVRDVTLADEAMRLCTESRAIDGNICRCTGYAGIVESISAAAEQMRRQGKP